MRRCAFLTLENPAGFVIDDDLACPPLRELGWMCDSIPWTTSGARWADYDAVIVRSTWDYTIRPDEFLATLQQIDDSGAPLFNSLDMIRWNVEKTYLRDLEDRGVPVVPTIWFDRLHSGQLRAVLRELDEAVVKPVLGAGAIGAFRLNHNPHAEQLAAVETYFADAKAMVQPFVPSVTSEGEFSLFYFNGRYSHAILKTPKPDDFRVQEEHGAAIRAIDADEMLRRAGDVALNALGECPLYARADLVRSNDGTQFWLMELELIEPSLYLRTDAGAPQRFAEAIATRVP
jgi:glutathione synthase/RimK-type ligase-like ATP-grasp enzyme